jgi:phenylpyruvate tautomerase PptA (4-oxalocrotonate tautomerase family)
MKGLTEMPFVELYAPKGALDSERGRAAKRSLVAEVMKAEGAPDTPAARAISWLVVTEPDEWFVGGEPVGAEPPRYVVRVSVPAGSLDDAKRADMIDRVTRVLAGAEEVVGEAGEEDEVVGEAGGEDPDAERLYREPAAWVHIHEVPEGNWGAAGRPVGLRDIIGYVATGELASTPA